MAPGQNAEAARLHGLLNLHGFESALSCHAVTFWRTAPADMEAGRQLSEASEYTAGLSALQALVRCRGELQQEPAPRQNPFACKAYTERNTLAALDDVTSTFRLKTSDNTVATSCDRPALHEQHRNAATAPAFAGLRHERDLSAQLSKQGTLLALSAAARESCSSVPHSA